MRILFAKRVAVEHETLRVIVAENERLKRIIENRDVDLAKLKREPVDLRAFIEGRKWGFHLYRTNNVFALAEELIERLQEEREKLQTTLYEFLQTRENGNEAADTDGQD